MDRSLERWTTPESVSHLRQQERICRSETELKARCSSDGNSVSARTGAYVPGLRASRQILRVRRTRSHVLVQSRMPRSHLPARRLASRATRSCPAARSCVQPCPLKSQQRTTVLLPCMRLTCLLLDTEHAAVSGRACAAKHGATSAVIAGTFGPARLVAQEVHVLREWAKRWLPNFRYRRILFADRSASATPPERVPLEKS